MNEKKYSKGIALSQERALHAGYWKGNLFSKVTVDLMNFWKRKGFLYLQAALVLLNEKLSSWERC